MKFCFCLIGSKLPLVPGKKSTFKVPFLEIEADTPEQAAELALQLKDGDQRIWCWYQIF